MWPDLYFFIEIFIDQNQQTGDGFKGLENLSADVTADLFLSFLRLANGVAHSFEMQ